MSILTVHKLHKSFGDTAAVEGISFTLEKGRCTSLLGPNGAGKTTALKMLAGLIRPTKGEIRFDSFEERDIRNLIGYLPQYPGFYNWMSASEYMDYMGQLFGMSRREVRGRSSELLELVGLKDAVRRRIGGFSGGMKQRLGIAQALINRPALLILDEPVSALDPIGRREIMELIQHIKQDTTILFSTHVLHDAEEISDDILIMQKGRIVVSGSLDELRREHREPLIRVEWEASPGKWAQALKERLGDLVKNISVNGLSVQIEVSDIEAAMPLLLADLASFRAPVRKVEAAAASLEELFMKVVSV
jgi:ABC-2 type transport system ATP-binding protein